MNALAASSDNEILDRVKTLEENMTSLRQDLVSKQGLLFSVVNDFLTAEQLIKHLDQYSINNYQ